MDRGAWQAIVHGVTKSQTRLSDFNFTFHFHALEREMDKLPVPPEAGRLYTIVCIAVGVLVNLSGELESHLRGLDLNTPNCPGTLLIGAVN